MTLRKETFENFEGKEEKNLIIFVTFVEDNDTMNSILYFKNHVFCAKPKEVTKSLKLNFSLTNNCFDLSETYTGTCNKQQSIKINWIRALIIVILFIWKISIPTNL